ncbi:hypothetical protein BBJ28_00023218 [Nothophytophthora sp. Chile5]|nr:hypothetical protein BBJ28_00023218 [Nothophytophthora sp. Chile5]
MQLGRTLLLMLVAAAFVCSGNLCISASKEGGRVPYSSVTVTLLVEALKLAVALAAVVSTRTPPPAGFQTREALLYAVPALLSTLENNLAYLILRFLDAATVSVLWNLKVLLTAVLFRLVLKHPLSELHALAIALLVLGVLTSQSDRARGPEGAATDSSGNGSGSSEADDKQRAAGVALVLLAVTLSSCSSVFAEWTLKRLAHWPFLWQNAQLYSFGVLFNGVGVLLVDGEAVRSLGFFHGYSGWTAAVVAVNCVAGLAMTCILKYLDNMACVYSHAMAMMLTTLASVLFFAFSPSLEFACGLGVLVISVYLYHHPLAEVAAAEPAPLLLQTTDSDSESPTAESSQPLKPKTLQSYEKIPLDTQEEDLERN